MAKKTPAKIISKKHLARQERENRQTRLITGVAIGVVALIILGIVYGLLNDTLFLRWRPAVTVNGETLSLQEFQARVRASRESLIGQYMQYQAFANAFGIDLSTNSSLSQSLQQISSELNSSTTLGSSVIDDMVNDLLIQQYARANGITVSASEVDKAIQEGLNYYPNGTPTPTLTPAELVYSTLNPTQLALITPTITPTLAPTLTPLPTRTLVQNATPTLVPSLTASPTPYTTQGFETQYQNSLKVYKSIGMSEAEFRRIYYQNGLIRDKVEAKVTAGITHTQEEVWARHILVTDEATAKDIYNQLQNGADFATLAAKYSIDTSSKDKGGDLGWFGKGKMVAEFENAVWTMKVGEISQPVKSTYGYHIIEVLGHENRPLTDTEYQDAKTTAFNNWLQDQRSKSKVVINDNWTNYVPTKPSLADAQAHDNATSTAFVSTFIAKSTTTAKAALPTATK